MEAVWADIEWSLTIISAVRRASGTRESAPPNRQASTMISCIFCRIIAGEIPADRVYESDQVIAFRDINPQAPQHVLVVPKQHVEKLADIGSPDTALMGGLLVETAQIAKKLGMEDQGYRVIINNGEAAGQSVWHIHLHLLSGRPFRWPPG